MSANVDLASFMQGFAQALHDPDSPIDSALLEQIEDGKDLIAAQRVQVYRANVLGARIRSLENIYRYTQKILGEAYFGQLARAFCIAHPSFDRDLDHCGALFPAWLEEQIEQRDELQDYVYLADFVRLELAHQQAQFAPDASVFDFAAFQTAASEPSRVRFALAPSVTLLRSAWPIEEVWSINQGEQAQNIEFDGQVRRLAIARRDLETEHHLLAEPAFGLLLAIQQGHSLEQLAQAGEAIENLADLIQSQFIDRFSVDT